MSSEQVKKFIPIAEPDLSDLEGTYLLDAFRSGWISSIGRYIEQFEREFAQFCEVEHAVAVTNGTVAIQLALLAAGVGPGDEVVVPALTFVATAAAVKHVGAEPVFVDSEPEIGTMDPVAVARAIGPRTKAIIPVHVYGHPADMDPILEIARSRNLVVIEDAAEAHGARYKGRRVGSMGDMATYSFYGNKLLTTGEGGMVVTSDPKLEARLRFLKDHAMDPNRRYWHPEVGYNFRMTNLQAAVGCAQLRRFDEIMEHRRNVVALYRTAFESHPHFVINPARTWAQAVPWLVCLLLPEGTTRAQRDDVAASLKSDGFDTRPYFHPLSAMPPYEQCKRVGRSEGLPVAESLSARGMNLPSVRMVSPEDAASIAEAVRRGLHS